MLDVEVQPTCDYSNIILADNSLPTNVRDLYPPFVYILEIDSVYDHEYSSQLNAVGHQCEICNSVRLSNSDFSKYYADNSSVVISPRDNNDVGTVRVTVNAHFCAAPWAFTTWVKQTVSVHIEPCLTTSYTFDPSDYSDIECTLGVDC